MALKHSSIATPMRRQRLTASAVVTLIVMLLTTGATFVTAHPHEGGRRRSPPARVLRGGPQRLDAADVVSHETEHHDPIASPVADGLTTRAHVEAVPGTEGADGRLDIHASPPGVPRRRFSAAGDGRMSAVHAALHVVRLRRPSSRQILGRAPPVR